MRSMQEIGGVSGGIHRSQVFSGSKDALSSGKDDELISAGVAPKTTIFSSLSKEKLAECGEKHPFLGITPGSVRTVRTRKHGLGKRLAPLQGMVKQGLSAV
jgi:hypothetical protein